MQRGVLGREEMLHYVIGRLRYAGSWGVVAGVTLYSTCVVESALSMMAFMAARGRR